MRARRAWLFLALGAGLSAGLGTGCAGSEALSRELSLLRRDVREIRKDLVETQRQVERLDSRLTLLALGSGGVERAPSTPVAAAPRAERPAPTSRAPRPKRPLPVVRLGQQADPATPVAGAEDGGYAYEEGALDDGSPPILIELKPGVDTGERLSVDHNVLKRPDPVLQASDAPASRAQYDQALATFRKENKPDVALSQFKAFLRTHPRSRYADNAKYWMAECLYSLGRFDQALRAFDGLVDDHPRSAKVPYAMLRSAEVHAAEGRGTRARQMLKALVKAHPNSEPARRARERLKAKGN